MTTVNFYIPIQERIKKVEERMLAQSEGHHPDLGAALKHLLSSGGKRIRPSVALLTGGMLGGDPDRLITLGAAIELLHTATLVHDDLIDGALLRRGIATINSQWSPAATVLTGDFIFAQAAKLASETDSVDVMHLFAETLSAIVNGELTQLFSSRGLASRDDYYHRIYEKTASMFELATAAAAMLSPVDSDHMERVRRFGYEIGMAFQVVDDILDFTGEAATVGKPVASDLRQGLITLPALHYLEANPGDPELESIIAGKPISEERLNHLVSSIRKSGAIQKSADEARHFVQCSLDILKEEPESIERDALEDLAEYIVRRHF